MVDQKAAAKIKEIEDTAAILAGAAMIGAQAYANGFMGHPAIVKQHFTPGNAGRYGWQPLTQAYAARKAGNLTRARKGGGPAATQKLSTGQRVKIDPAVPFQSSTGTMTGQGTMANLPMLVASGKLRAAVESPAKHQITGNGSLATIVFNGLPDYAEYHHQGSGHNPKRSPVEPGAHDRDQVVAIMIRYVKGRKTGQGGAVPQSVQPGSTPRIV